MAETIVTQNSVISGIESQKDVVVLILAASRTDETGARVPITDAQKETAMNAAKAVLQCVGAEVAANSTAWILDVYKRQVLSYDSFCHLNSFQNPVSFQKSPVPALPERSDRPLLTHYGRAGTEPFYTSSSRCV